MDMKAMRGDIFDSGADLITIPVNCVGVPGAGLAKAWADRYPTEAADYRRLCRSGVIQPGKVWLMRQRKSTDSFALFPTKRHWREKSRLDDVRNGLADLAGMLRVSVFKTVAIPPLGCGLGGLAWAEVRPLIITALGDLPQTQVLLYEPR